MKKKNLELKKKTSLHRWRPPLGRMNRVE